MKTKFEEQLKNTFNQETPDILNDIKSSPEFFVPEKAKRSFRLSNFLPNRSQLAFVTSFLFVIALIFVVGRGDNDTIVTAATVTIDINPSIEITIDENELVIDVTALSNDGIEIVKRDLSYRGLTLDEVVEYLVQKLEERGFIVNTGDEDNIIIFRVDSNSEEIRSRLEEKLETKIGMEMSKYTTRKQIINSRKIDITQQQQNQLDAEATRLKITRAKLTLIFRIIQLDPSKTVEDLAPLTIKQLYNMYQDLLDENAPETPGGPGNHGPSNRT